MNGAKSKSTVETGSVTLLPPRAGVCQACAVDHKPEEPHNQQSLYWQYWFYARNGRWPEWPDALAHCTDELYGFWRKELVTFGVEIPQRAATPVAARNEGRVMSESSTLLISQIRTDGATQPRAELNYEVIEEYSQAMRAGVVFPPVVVFYDGADYWLADGFHRLAAAGGAELDCIAAEVRQGTREDAQWSSFSANKSHGLRRSLEDIQRVVRAALAHILSRDLSDIAIAAHVGVDRKTVGRHREAVAPILGVTQDRKVTRKGTTYTQNVSQIGPDPAPRRTVSPIRTEPEYSEAAPESVGVENLIRHFEFMRLLRRVPLTPREMDALSVDLHGIELYEESAERLREIAAKAAHLRDAKDVPA